MLYNGTYGYGIYKRSQINIGTPYRVQSPRLTEEEEIFGDGKKTESADPAEVAESDEDKDLRISQDIVYKAKEEAAQLRREAELEAGRIVRDAKEETIRIKSETEEKAREEGYSRGEELAKQHYSSLLAEAEDYKSRSKTEYEEALASTEQDIVNLVLDIAAKIVGDEIRSNREAILGIVRETINACSNHEHVLLKVSDDDYDVVLENKDKLRSMVGGLDELEIRRDSTLDKGSCVVENDFGSVDGSCGTRLESIRKAFFEVLGENDNE